MPRQKNLEAGWLMDPFPGLPDPFEVPPGGAAAAMKRRGRGNDAKPSVFMLAWINAADSPDPCAYLLNLRSPPFACSRQSHEYDRGLFASSTSLC